jgi:glycosyltransferase involved in cell wall biosynthesis
MTSAHSEPLVSTIMPSFNSERFLAETLDSLFSQTYRSIELVLVDGGSTDRTLEIAGDYARRFPGRVQIIHGDRGTGPCHRRNQAIDAVRGSLVCWLDTDDLWLPTKVEQQVEIMETRPEVGLVYTRFESFDSASGNVLGRNDRSLELDGRLLEPLFMSGCFIGAVTTMFRRSALDRRGVRLREKDFSFGDDYYLWLVLSLDWDAAFIPCMLARYRRHDANEGDRSGREMNIYRGMVGLQHEFLEEFSEAKRTLGSTRRRAPAHWYMVAAGQELRSRRWVSSAAFLARAFVLAPLHVSVRAARGLARHLRLRRSVQSSVGVRA